LRHETGAFMKKQEKGDFIMKKWNYKAITAACLCGLMVAGTAGCSSQKTSAAETAISPTTEAVMETTTEAETAAETVEKIPAGDTTSEAGSDIVQLPAETESAAMPVISELYQIWGPVLWVEGDQVAIDNKSEVSSQGEIVLNIDPEATYILDGLDGFPVQISDLKKDEVIYAYIGPAMTMSLPPQTYAEAIICQVPQDAAAAQYILVKDMEQQKDDSYVLTTSDDTQYQVPADCPIIPYLTRNMVVLADVQPASHCLIWSNDGKTVDKIVLFAK